MINFVNSFVSYGVVMLVTVVFCAAAVFAGITLRRKKNASAAPQAQTEEAQAKTEEA